MEEASTPLLLKLDVANAFSSLSRVKLMECLQRTCAHPSLAPWLCHLHLLAYQPAWLMVPASDAPCPWHCCEHGLIQGDPLSTMTFCLALTATMKACMSDLPLQPCLYVDDTCIAGDAIALNQAWPRISPALETLGLSLQPAKCQVYAPNVSMAKAQAPAIETAVPSWSDAGIEICGHTLADMTDVLPAGTADYIYSWLKRVVTMLDEDLTQLLALRPHIGQNALQILSRLLRSSIPTRVLHILRGCPSCFTVEFSEDIDTLLKTAWSTLLGMTAFDALQWKLLTAPISMGGFGSACH